MKKLTKAEEQVMKYLWKLKSAFMKDLVEQFPEPKPAYTTIATILTRMVEKGYVTYQQHGKVREYLPKLKKKDYFSEYFNGVVKDFFNDSTAQFASFFAAKEDLSLEELEQLRNIVDQQIENKKEK